MFTRHSVYSTLTHLYFRFSRNWHGHRSASHTEEVTILLLLNLLNIACRILGFLIFDRTGLSLNARDYVPLKRP